MSKRTFDAALGRRIRELRQKQGLTHEEVAHRLAQYGVATSRVSVGVTENGQRSVKAHELVVLPYVLGVQLEELLSGLPTQSPVKAGPDEATVKAAQRLNADPVDVDTKARQLWGRGLTAERDARLGAAKRSRADQARRGHVTRALIEELRKALPARPVSSEETST
jgi:transcriptional regulator with XRE-family HTH domain